MKISRLAKVRFHKISFITICAVAFIALFCLVVFFINQNTPSQQTATSRDERIEYNNSISTNLELSDVSVLEIADTYAHAAGTIYLTFDDGPGPYTARLLDILKQYNVKATFFVTGSGDDALIKREYDEGHTVGLHTWSHRYDIIYSSVENYFNDLNMVHDRVQRITGQDSKLIRFPGGSSNVISARYDGGIKIMSFLAQEVLNRGFSYFDWNLSSGDAGSATTSDEVFVNVAAHLKEGDNVVLQHDIKEFSVDAVERIIQYGEENGYSFDKLSIDSFAARHGVNN